jgi:hypothetical protein
MFSIQFKIRRRESRIKQELCPVPPTKTLLPPGSAISEN